MGLTTRAHTRARLHRNYSLHSGAKKKTKNCRKTGLENFPSSFPFSPQGQRRKFSAPTLASPSLIIERGGNLINSPINITANSSGSSVLAAAAAPPERGGGKLCRCLRCRCLCPEWKCWDGSRGFPSSAPARLLSCRRLRSSPPPSPAILPPPGSPRSEESISASIGSPAPASSLSSRSNIVFPGKKVLLRRYFPTTSFFSFHGRCGQRASYTSLSILPAPHFSPCQESLPASSYNRGPLPSSLGKGKGGRMKNTFAAEAVSSQLTAFAHNTLYFWRCPRKTTRDSFWT